MNSQKLIDVGFSRLPENTTISQLERKLHIPDHTSLPGFGQMTLDHVPQVAKLLENYLCQFDFFVTFTEEEVKHYFLPSDDLFYSYVVQEGDQVTDFISFYNLPSSVLNNPKHNNLKIAYLYYYATNSDKKRLTALMRDALVMAKKAGFDCFNCLEIMNNGEFLDELKFGKGTGDLKFYFYNYRCTDIPHDKMGFLML